jgi:hypothetical protein
MFWLNEISYDRKWKFRYQVEKEFRYDQSSNQNGAQLIRLALKRQSHEIDFQPLLFHKSTTPMSLINTLKYFRILLRIREASRI